MRVERDWLRNLVFGSDEARRFTQDSPILPDVWLVAGLFYCANAGARVDLLLTPFQNCSPSEAAASIRQRLETITEPLSPMTDSGVQPEDETPWSGGLSERRVVLKKYRTIAVNQTNIVAALTLEELIIAVLPLTPWWLRNILPKEPGPDAAEGARAADRHIRRDPKRNKREVAWLMHVVGTLVLCSQQSPEPDADLARSDDAPAWMSMDEARRLRRATRSDAERFAMILKDTVGQKREFQRLCELALKTSKVETLVWSVSLNREASVSISRSVPATKADAARRVFKINCDKLCWAVIDSGIDATHPALQDVQGQWRVESTYDFTNLRALVSLDANPTTGPTAVHAAALDTELIDRQAKRLRENLKAGRHLDWGALVPLLKLGHNPYSAPQNDHGTHVAGIIGARVAPELDPDAGEGLCPDIRFCDLRVLDAEGRGDEFSVIAALQFVRYLNANADRMVIHGVNLSLSLLHDVENYACGRTPVCDECERLVRSGVVVVVAAGNRGYERVLTPFGELEAYRGISITDPGNAEGVITVGSTHSEPHTYGVSYFSSRGPTGDGRNKPDILAPGEKIDSTILQHTYGTKDGTSMAAPHVSGVAALLMARHTEFIGDPARIKRILCESATDLGREKYFQGAGIVDALRALQST